MPRPGPRRGLVAFKLDDEGAQWIDQRAIEEGFIKGDGKPNLSKMIRLALTYTRATMPRGWRP